MRVDTSSGRVLPPLTAMSLMFNGLHLVIRSDNLKREAWINIGPVWTCSESLPKSHLLRPHLRNSTSSFTKFNEIYFLGQMERTSAWSNYFIAHLCTRSNIGGAYVVGTTFIVERVYSY